ncbi:PIN domain-containing protein [Erythrobacter sp. A6_0]|uniref:PIN domain-containing protein n=1 Tax=Erythrobacter sp. A6_0 TaxID=2821089 RepID=UPI001ADB2BE4|nr:PIN domain-containing protein [Erythrobacter sp. A6_0]MBO9510880.1 hypothetical protein [Erythrobacter sp. A6_0]
MTAIPLSTTAYDNVVLLDSQVVLEAKPLDQLPWSDLFTGSVLLLVARQVQTEIDRRKNDGRLGKRARAFNKLLDGYIVDRVPSEVLSNPKVDVATVANRPIDWDALDDLDRDDPDDRIVAQALNAILDDPSRIVLLSHDMRPRDAAATHGLSAVKLPEGWLRDPEPSPHERRIVELEARNKLLSADQPLLKVRIEAVTPTPWTYREVGEAPEDQAAAILEAKLATAPTQSRGGPFGVGMGSYDYSHDGRIKAWQAVMREDVMLMHRGLTKLHAQHRVRVTIENAGSISAEDLSLEIRSGNAVLHSIPYWVLVTGPGAPHPRLLHERLPHLNPANFATPHREAFSFYWEERGPGDHLILSCKSFRQEKTHTAEISLEILAGTLPKAQIEAVVTAANLKGDVRGKLLVDVNRVVTPFDQVYDVGGKSLAIRPPFELPDDNLDFRDYTWYRNGGSEHEVD